MNSLKVLYLINLLQNATTGKEEILAQLYENAVNDNSDFRELSAVLEDNVFFSEMGKSLHQSGQKLITAVKEQPSDVFGVLRTIRQTHELIMHEAQTCQHLMEQPGAFAESITVLEKKRIPDYLKMLELVAAICTYLVAVYDGSHNLKNLSWVENSGLTERIHAINFVYLPALCQIDKLPKAWILTRKDLGGKNLLGGTFFSISYLPYEHIKVLTSGLRSERLTPHFFLNMRAAETGEKDVPYCWGVGNIVSTNPKDSLRLLKSQVITKPAMPSRDDLWDQPVNPLKCLVSLSGQLPFCISPDDLTALMNYWQMGYEVTRRRQNKICIFCGKPVASQRLVCSSHFSMEGLRR